MYEIELPWPPSLNGHKAVVNGRMILSKKGRDYIKACAYSVNSLYMKKISGNLSVTLDLFPPDNRNRDIDNYIKAVFDAMTHCGVWVDDSQVKVLTIRMLDKVAGGSVLIGISSIKKTITA